MAAQSTHLITRLRVDLRNVVRIVFWIHRAGEHEVLPDQDAEPIALVVEMIVLVNSAAPDAQHRHIRVAGHRQQSGIALIWNGAYERVARDPVGASGEDRDSVEHKTKEAGAALGRIR